MSNRNSISAESERGSFTKTVAERQSTPRATEQTRLVRAKPGRPCPICEKPDWCSMAENGAFAICMRSPSDHESKNGGWVHRLDDLARSAPEIKLIQVVQHPRAGIAERDQVYRELLDSLDLSHRDRKELHSRGLDDRTIRINGYRTVPLPSQMNEVMAAMKGRDLRGIPGFFTRDGNWRLNLGEWRDKQGIIQSFHQGFLVPVRDVEGRIEGFQIRRASVNQGEPKYIWLSSNDKEHGTSSRAPVHFRNSARIRETGQAILTEGALKADVSARLLSNAVGVIAIAGVQSFPDDLGDRLRRQLPELRQVTIAFDADLDRKPEVRHGLDRLKATLEGAGLETSGLKWREEQGKGLDDYLHQSPARQGAVLEALHKERALIDRSPELDRSRGFSR